MMCGKQKVLLIISLFLTSCSVGPDYHRPGVTLSTKFKEAKGSAFKPEPKDGWKLAKPQDEVNRGEWWKIFHDPELNALEEQLNLYNQNIANAVANYYQTQYIVDEARANYFPTVASAFNIFRQRQAGGATSFFSSSNGTTSSQTAVTGAVIPRARTNTTYSAFLTASWEPDIWGLVRRTVEADVAAAQANQALLAVTALSMQGSLAQFYFELRALDRDQQLLNDTVVGYKKALALTKNRYHSGVASRADIVQAQSQLETAQAQAINNGILRSQYEHAIAVLIGRPPANFAMHFLPLRARPPVIPVTIPSVWLERRPDVAQAERLMQQANAQIGVAVAAFYPSLSLSATASASGRNFYRLIHTPALGWSSGLQLAETIFDAGLRNATVGAAKAAYMAQIAAYRQTVLTAFQDVEDNLVSLRLLKEQSVVQDAAAASAQEALKLVINQYKAGTVPYSSVITAQIAAYNAQKAAYDVIGLEMTSAVGLVKALGGGWNVRDLSPV
ncbi:Outer membrane protein OprM precursor [Legionella massiliensis]|uniref:Outer membrane protein OprM n=1 Tax=Legionella massiliensis TaxID=1034943 RepID=A0A078KWH2_9GAMM|nr:efflux transporter outer membrane subunit [Legionella massiliensis]CDZ76038.1 Outer membrane protein OprM precursor [Legionella massiliensis]CEE11776.1 Outer membrane protein OprM precursor [Legionella massiliensis]